MCIVDSCYYWAFICRLPLTLQNKYFRLLRTTSDKSYKTSLWFKERSLLGLIIHAWTKSFRSHALSIHENYLVNPFVCWWRLDYDNANRVGTSNTAIPRYRIQTHQQDCSEISIVNYCRMHFVRSPQIDSIVNPANNFFALCFVWITFLKKNRTSTTRALYYWSYDNLKHDLRLSTLLFSAFNNWYAPIIQLWYIAWYLCCVQKTIPLIRRVLILVEVIVTRVAFKRNGVLKQFV